KNAVLDEKITEGKVKEFRGIGLPQVKAQAGITDNVIKQKFIFDSKTFSLPLFSDAYGALAQLDPNFGKKLANYNDSLNALPKSNDINPTEVGTRYNTSLGFTASWLVADATYFLGLKAQKELQSLMKYNTIRSKNDIAEQVSKAYYNVLISRKRLALLIANTNRLEQLKNETEAYYKQGFVEQIDVKRLQVTYNNLLTEQQKVTELVLLTDALLKFQIGYDVNAPISLVDTLNQSDLQNTVLNTAPFRPESRIEYQLLSKQKTLNQLNLKRYQLGTLPNLVAIGNYNTQHSSDKFEWYNKLNKFYNSAFIGLQLNFTIFDGLQNKYRKSYTRLEIQKNENDLFNLKNALSLDLLSSNIALKNSLLAIKSQSENLELATDVVRISKIKYQQGVGSSLEVLNAETSLKDAQTNYFSALYDAYIAKVNYEKAMGTLVK
ncbi:MAG: hypothetical protein RL065_1893, partial [Bacteroidota bacterium]